MRRNYIKCEILQEVKVGGMNLEEILVTLLVYTFWASKFAIITYLIYLLIKTLKIYIKKNS